jgi:hypothetical protein
MGVNTELVNFCVPAGTRAILRNRARRECVSLSEYCRRRVCPDLAMPMPARLTRTDVYEFNADESTEPGA